MEETKPKPRVVLGDGNAFAIMGRCRESARKAGWTLEEWREFRDEVMAGTYEALLVKVLERFEVELESDG